MEYLGLVFKPVIDVAFRRPTASPKCCGCGDRPGIRKSPLISFDWRAFVLYSRRVSAAIFEAVNCNVSGVSRAAGELVAVQNNFVITPL